MSISEGLKTTLGIINAAGWILDKDDPRDARAISQLDKAARTAKRIDNAGSAITSLSSQTTILSRAFVDESIIDEPILPNLFRSIHEWYAAQIISALHLSRFVSDKTTVQDVMSIVQTGHNKRQESMLNNVLAKRMGIESFLSNYLGEAATESSREDPLELVTKQQLDDLEAERDHYKNKAKNEDKKTKDLGQVQIRAVNTSEHRIGPMGELYEVKMDNPNGNGQSVTIPVFIQMQPSIIPVEAAPRFVDMNVAPSTWQRWTMMRAGELTFWKDFLLNRDLIRRQKSIIKDPKTANAFSDFLKTVSKKDQYAIGDATDRLGSRQSSNLANSVIIFSEETVSQAKVDSGVDLHNENDRKRYFRDTYSMIIVIVDSLHQRVTVYFNGLDGDINVSYSEFRPKDQKFDPKEFMGALQAFSSNNIGRMR